MEDFVGNVHKKEFEDQKNNIHAFYKMDTITLMHKHDINKFKIKKIILFQSINILIHQGLHYHLFN